MISSRDEFWAADRSRRRFATLDDLMDLTRRRRDCVDSQNRQGWHVRSARFSAGNVPFVLGFLPVRVGGAYRSQLFARSPETRIVIRLTASAPPAAYIGIGRTGQSPPSQARSRACFFLGLGPGAWVSRPTTRNPMSSASSHKPQALVSDADSDPDADARTGH